MQPTSTSPLHALTGARIRILVVEDEWLIRMMLSDGLRDAGYQVIEACNADEALTVINSAAPDLMVSDVRMPGSMDGMALLATVRETMPALPVIITSAHLQPSRAIADGATQFVAKPYSLGAVVAAIEAELGKGDD